jgi:predicted RNA-binding Zn-ribbon protein involved in translation (DUF1610 family)
MDIPFIPVCVNCFADLETFEQDSRGNIVSWICPECGKIQDANENKE